MKATLTLHCIGIALQEPVTVQIRDRNRRVGDDSPGEDTNAFFPLVGRRRMAGKEVQKRHPYNVVSNVRRRSL